MNPKDAYLQIANRSLDAADASLNAGVQEAAGFNTYHAFESLGGAVCYVRGRHYPRSHIKKMNQFVAASSRFAFRFSVGHLVITLSSLRNDCLYPKEQSDGSMEIPENVISSADARDLINRVRGILGRIIRQI